MGTAESGNIFVWVITHSHKNLISTALIKKVKIKRSQKDSKLYMEKNKSAEIHSECFFYIEQKT